MACHSASSVDWQKSPKGKRDKAENPIYKGLIHPAQTIRSP
ncbi:hypothetical protein GT623_13950 [Burkholderia thailandensis]|nr:hypothetical protein [Burkholderia thailandensis]